MGHQFSTCRSESGCSGDSEKHDCLVVSEPVETLYRLLYEAPPGVGFAFGKKICGVE